MLPDPKIKCPATGFERSCREIISECDCPKFVKISGVNPNDGQAIDKFGCIDSFLHMLLIENSMLQRQTGAAVESFRNETVKVAAATIAAADHAASSLARFRTDVLLERDEPAPRSKVIPYAR